MNLIAQWSIADRLLQFLLEAVVVLGPFVVIFGFAIRLIWVDRRGRKITQPPDTSRGFEVLPPK
jgi:hypothetical protein